MHLFTVHVTASALPMPSYTCALWSFLTTVYRFYRRLPTQLPPKSVRAETHMKVMVCQTLCTHQQCLNAIHSVTSVQWSKGENHLLLAWDCHKLARLEQGTTSTFLLTAVSARTFSPPEPLRVHFRKTQGVSNSGHGLDSRVN